MVVDDSALFRSMVIGKYETVEDLVKRVQRFQIATATCFSRACSKSAAAYHRGRRKPVPDGERCGYIMYRCVHRKRSAPRGKRYKSYDCKARFSVVLKDGKYVVGSYVMTHSHDFHVGNPWLYAANRRLSPEQEREVLRLMGSFHSTPDLRHFIYLEYGKMVTRLDLYNLRIRHRNGNACEVSDVSTMLQEHGACRLVYEGSEIRYVFFSPSLVGGIVSRYCEVILCDATHQLIYGGYVLWHCMLVDVTGLGISFFYALLPDETSYSYGQAVEAMRDMVPSTLRCRTVVMDKCAAQIRAFRRFYPDAKVVFCRYHVKVDMSRRCGRLRGISDPRRMQLRGWLHNLIYTRDASVFDSILNAVGRASPELYGYLCATWIPHADSWAAHRLRDTILFGCHTTNRVENENRHLKEYLSERSSLLTLFNCVVDRVNTLVHRRNSILGRRCMSEIAVPSEVSSVASVFCKLSDFAGDVFMQHFRTSTVLRCRADGPYWLVNCPRSRVRRVYITRGSECDCEFHRQWRLPCAHICYVAARHPHAARNILHGCRWIAPRLPAAASSESVASAERVQIVQRNAVDGDAVLNRTLKLRRTQHVLGDIGAQLVTYGSQNFSGVLNYLKMVALLMSKDPTFQLYGRTSRWPVPLHLDTEENVRMLCGFPTAGTSAAGSASAVCPTSTGEAVGPSQGTQVNEAVRGNETETPVPSTSTGVSRKRKSPLKCRVTEVSPDKSALRGKRFRILRTRTSRGYRVPVSRRRGTQGFLSKDLCGVCQQEEDVDGDGESVQWVQCDACSHWYHASCVCYSGSEEFLCFSCSS